MVKAEELKPWILAIVGAIVLIVVGAVAANLAFGMGQYVLNQINSSLSTPIPALVQASQLQILSTAIIIAGIVVLVVSIAFMIRALMGITESAT